MRPNFHQILQIASDALSLKYSLEHATLYWNQGQNILESKASIQLMEGSTESAHMALSGSMMSAIRKPLIIKRKKVDPPRLQIIIPLMIENRKLGVMVFWGLLDEAEVSSEDRRFLDMIGLISIRVLLSLEEGLLIGGAKSMETIDSIPEDEEIVVEPEPVETLQEDRAQSIVLEDDLDLFLGLSGLGFLVFNSKGEIRADHVLVKEAFFNQELGNRSALELLFEWGEPVNRESASFEKNPDYETIADLMKSVFSRVTDIDVLKELFPEEISTGEKSYKMVYHYLKSTAGQQEDSILCVFQDISAEKRLDRRYLREVNRANMIIKVALDVDGYDQYRQNTVIVFRRVENELVKSPDSISLSAILHHIQAIQGGAEIYEINEISTLSEPIITNLEQILSRAQPVSRTEIEQISEQIDRLKSSFELLQSRYLNNLVSDEQILDKAVYRVTNTKIARIGDEIAEQVIKHRMEDLESVFEKNYLPFTRLKSLEDITQKRLERIKQYIWGQVVEEGAKDITKIMAAFRRQPIGLVLKRYAIIAVNLGERLKKRVEVEIKGADIEVPIHTLENLFTGLTFVIRNCVEHGLENMEERIALDKPLEGNIVIEAELDNDILKITISDDGRGIDVNRIKRAAIGNRVISEAEANRITNKEILELMFTKGFSTKRDSSGAFGRGVGLSAVGVAIEELEGDVKVRTELKKGTIIEVEIPLEQ
jgi:signal transduction histidine kinase